MKSRLRMAMRDGEWQFRNEQDHKQGSKGKYITKFIMHTQAVYLHACRNPNSMVTAQPTGCHHLTRLLTPDQAGASNAARAPR